MRRSTLLALLSAFALLLTGGTHLATEAPASAEPDTTAPTVDPQPFGSGLEAEPVDGGHCQSLDCPAGCSESGLEAPLDLGVTGCRDPIQGIIQCSGGETVNAHVGMCTGSQACLQASYIEGPYFCD